MYELDDLELMSYIKEDLPYFDLTTSLQKCNNKNLELEIYTREEVVVSCSEEAARIAKLLNCEVLFILPSKEIAKKDDVLLRYKGTYENVHKAWRLTQILLEYSCKISTTANKMKQNIDEVNKNCELLTTRKTFPFAKRFCIKAAIIGNAMPHRLGLSESILFFDAHRLAFDSNEEFYEDIKRIKNEVTEKKVNVESEDYEDCINLMKAGADVLQLDKLDIQTIKNIVSYKNENFPNVKIIVAGGINVSNVKEYAACQINGVVTSSVYVCGLANLSSHIRVLN